MTQMNADERRWKRIEEMEDSKRIDPQMIQMDTDRIEFRNSLVLYLCPSVSFVDKNRHLHTLHRLWIKSLSICGRSLLFHLKRARLMRRCILFTALIALGVGGCSPPQIGQDKETFKAVDYLYTAVSLRAPKHLERCEKSLHDLKAQGKLPDSAAQALDAIIAQAREGDWEPAQRRLGDFMRGQTR